MVDKYSDHSTDSIGPRISPQQTLGTDEARSQEIDLGSLERTLNNAFPEPLDPVTRQNMLEMLVNLSRLPGSMGMDGNGPAGLVLVKTGPRRYKRVGAFTMDLQHRLRIMQTRKSELGRGRHWIPTR